MYLFSDFQSFCFLFVSNSSKSCILLFMIHRLTFIVIFPCSSPPFSGFVKCNFMLSTTLITPILIFRALVTFGLNALHGRQHGNKQQWGGKWDSSNARDFISYTVSKGYQIHSWEFGKFSRLLSLFIIIYLHM